MRDIIAIVAGLFLLMVPIVMFTNYMEYWSCQSKAQALDIPYTWGPMQGCIVRWHGELVPIERIGVRVID